MSMAIDLKLLTVFLYLGNTFNHQSFLDDEIALQIKKASDTFASLKDQVWGQKGAIKINVQSLQCLCTVISGILLRNLASVL